MQTRQKCNRENLSHLFSLLPFRKTTQTKLESANRKAWRDRLMDEGKGGWVEAGEAETVLEWKDREMKQ